MYLYGLSLAVQHSGVGIGVEERRTRSLCGWVTVGPASSYPHRWVVCWKYPIVLRTGMLTAVSLVLGLIWCVIRHRMHL